MDERGIDVTLFSPRASAMAPHVGDAAVSLEWSRRCNDLVHRVATLYPERFVPVAQLPQFPGADLGASVAELRRCVEELGFVGCNLNPDPSGGFWTSPPLTDRSWYPLYEAAIELDVPAMVHVSASATPVFHGTGAYYINADTTAFMQLVQGNLFGDLPDLRLVIPHGGGAVPYHWGRYRGLADMLKQPPVESNVMGSNITGGVFFDTCVYHQPGIDLLLDVIDTRNILFGSEMVGAVRGIDERTGHHYDDTRRYIEALLAGRRRPRGRVRGQRPARLPAAGPRSPGLTRGQIVSGTRRWAIATSNSAVSMTSIPRAGANSSRNSRAPSFARSRSARRS